MIEAVARVFLLLLYIFFFSLISVSLFLVLLFRKSYNDNSPPKVLFRCPHPVTVCFLDFFSVCQYVNYLILYRTFTHPLLDRQRSRPMEAGLREHKGKDKNRRSG